MNTKSRRRLSVDNNSDVPGFSSPIHGKVPEQQRLGIQDDRNDCNAKKSTEKNKVEQENMSRRRLSVFGVMPTCIENTFETRSVQVRGLQKNDDWASTLCALGIAFTCRKGLKPESPNQDDFFMITMLNWTMLGVFDGHGPLGHNIAHFAQQQLPGLIYRDSNFKSCPLSAMRNSFLMVHQLLVQQPANTPLDAWSSGTTATVVLHKQNKNKLYIAHVGDSRAVKGSIVNSEIMAIDLVIDHKPTIPRERARIEAAGGRIHHVSGDIPHRIFLPGKPYPGLAMSRAIGDIAGTPAGIIPDPDLSEFDVNSNDLFIIVASDGVWEFISSQEAVDIVSRHGKQAVKQAVSEIAKESWNRWLQEEGNVVDDITIQVYYIR